MGKGAENERQKAKEWSLWVSDGTRDDIFWRDNSGARATTRAKIGKTTANAHGDLICVDPMGEPLLRCLTIEAKKGYNKDLDLLSLIDMTGSNQLIRKFWNQVVRDSEEAFKAGWGKEPVLIIHRNNKKSCIFMRSILFSKMKEYCGDLKNDYFVLNIKNVDQIIVIRLKDFFDWMNPLFFKDLYDKESKYKELSET